MWKYIINLMVEHHNLFPMVNFAYEHEAIQLFMSIYSCFDITHQMTLNNLFYTPLTTTNKGIGFLADGFFYDPNLSVKQRLIETFIPIQYKYKNLNPGYSYDKFNMDLYSEFFKYHKTSSIIEIGVNDFKNLEKGELFRNFKHDTIRIIDYNYLNLPVTEEFKTKANLLIEHLKSSQDFVKEQENINSVYHQNYYKINVDSNLPMTQMIKNWKNNF